MKIGDRVRLKTGPGDVANGLVGLEITGTIVARETDNPHSEGKLLMDWDEVFNVVPGRDPGTREDPRPWDMNSCWVNDKMVEVIG